MKWFEKSSIKDREQLTDEQIAYLLRPSLSIFGPLNCLFRRHFDYLFVNLFLIAAGLFLGWVEYPDELIIVYSLINSILLCAVTYFFIKHGRRLAWNRNQWKDFDSFQASENKWISLSIAGASFTFIKGYQAASNDPYEAVLLAITLILLFSLPFINHWRINRNLMQDQVKVNPQATSLL